MIDLVRYHTMRPARGGGLTSSVRVALVKEGRKFLQVVALDATADGGLRIWKEKKTERKYMKPLMHGNRPYNMNRALVVFRRFAKSHGCTKGARKILREAAA